MTSKTKTKDVGWMYYTPNKRNDRGAVAYPAASQIPGLSAQASEPPPEERKIWIKDSDSPYIKLAKQGGRQNLLAFRENERKTVPKDYPRCEWFYQDDQLEGDEADKEPYVFRLPEYMVHQDASQATIPGMNGGLVGGRDPPGRVPYATDKITVYERDGKCTDKTIAIPNDRRVGYGVRQEKTKNAPPQKFNAPLTKPRSKATGAVHEEDPTSMSKLLGGTYEREWYQRHHEWEAAHPVKPRAGEKMSSEYRDAFEKAMAAKASDTAAERAAGVSVRVRRGSEDDPREKRKINKQIEKMEKEVFKLSRFKNVNAKVDTNRERSAPVRSMYEPSQSDAPRRQELVT